MAHALVHIADRLSRTLAALHVAPPVSHVYNVWAYAREPGAAYIERYAQPHKEVLLLGMNPGPFGMAQTGVPFGEVAHVRDWLGITGAVGRPDQEHPARPVTGFACPRTEISGARLWGWARAQFGSPEAFFARFYVYNYCPLAFMGPSGGNITPDKLARAERDALYAACDAALARVVDALGAPQVVGIGGFAAKRAATALGLAHVAHILHPSPASPAANRGWATQATLALRALGLLAAADG